MEEFKININKKDFDEPVLLTGFHSNWLVGPFVMQYLAENLDFEPVGDVYMDSLPPVTLVHKNHIIKPLSLLWNKKHNLLLFQSLVPMAGQEWEMAEIVSRIADMVKSKEIITIDGVRTEQSDDIYFTTGCDNRKEVLEAGAVELDDAVIFGIAAVFLIRQICPLLCIYGKVEIPKDEGDRMKLLTLSTSNSAINVIRFLNEYLHIDVDIDALKEKSKKIEDKINQMIENVNKPAEKKPVYFG